MARTSCTRTPQAPYRAASAEITAVAVSRPSGGRGDPSGPANNVPRNRLRDAPSSTGMPGGDQLRQGVQQRPIVLSRLGESESGIDHQLGGIDTGGHRVVDAGQQLGAHLGHHVAVVRGLRAVGRTTPIASASAPRAHRPRPPAVPSPGSARPPDTSLTIRAPLCSAARATSACMVSMLTVMPCAASSLTTGTTRDVSTRGSIRVAPGRVDSPPTSTMPAPSAANARPCATASSASR